MHRYNLITQSFSFLNAVNYYLLYQMLRAFNKMSVKNLIGSVNAGEAEDMGSIPGSGRSPGGGNGNPLQCSCLENPMDRVTWWASPWGRKESDTTEGLSIHATQLVLSTTTTTKCQEAIIP